MCLFPAYYPWQLHSVTEGKKQWKGTCKIEYGHPKRPDLELSELQLQLPQLLLLLCDLGLFAVLCLNPALTIDHAVVNPEILAEFLHGLGSGAT